GAVDRLYEQLTLVPGKLRETLATGRKDALLSRELATLNREVPFAFDLEAFRRVEPDWARLRALWMELEFNRLLRDLPPPVATVSDEAVPALAARTLVAHDAKPLVESWLARGAAPPAIHDSAVAAYLLNPARSSYRLEELYAEAFGEGLPPMPAREAAELGRVLAARARGVHRYWEHAAAELRTRELWTVYEEIERPLVPVLARMERHGIRVDPARLEAFAKELERDLDNLTREIYRLAGEEFAIASPKQLAHILFEKLGLPALRRTKTGFSTDADVLTELALRHELPAKILEHRSLAKLKGTYADTLPGLMNPRTG